MRLYACVVRPVLRQVQLQARDGDRPGSALTGERALTLDDGVEDVRRERARLRIDDLRGLALWAVTIVEHLIEELVHEGHHLTLIVSALAKLAVHGLCGDRHGAHSRAGGLGHFCPRGA